MSLASRLGSGEVLALTAEVTHARRGGLRHAFRTKTDFLLLSPQSARPPRLMGRNRPNLISVYDKDHGGTRGAGSGAAWAEEQFARAGLPRGAERTIALLTQPRFLGFWFNPVSFWLLLEGEALLGVIAEVNNTFSQRHSYLLTAPDNGPIIAKTQLLAQKVFHVSPFQDVSGSYDFRFALNEQSIAIRINHIDGAAGVNTAMRGAFAPLTTRGILASALRRPGGALGVVAQIYWHAARLKLKGARYRAVAPLPTEDVTR